MAFSGAWANRTQQHQQVPLTPGIDPQHLQPEPDPNLFPGQRPDYVQTPGGPGTLPVALMGDLPQANHVGLGPVDHVDYQHPLDGMGSGAGLSVEEAISARRAHQADDGSVAARAYNAAIERADTDSYHLAILTDTVSDGDSPETTMLQRTGVGVPTDPAARLGRRLNRWFQGVIDMHWWDVTFRPLRPQYARPVPAHEVVDYNQTAPSTPSDVRYDPSSDDRWVTAMTRRAPGDWQAPFSYDGTAQTMVAASNQFGLPMEGL